MDPNEYKLLIKKVQGEYASWQSLVSKTDRICSYLNMHAGSEEARLAKYNLGQL